MRVTLTALLFCFCGFVIERSAVGETGSKTFEIKYINPERVRDLFSNQSFLIQVDRDGGFLTARGPQSFLNEVETAVKRLDVQPMAPRDVQVVVYVIGLTTASPGAMKLPDELAKVNPSFKLYSLLDTQLMRVREGEPGEARNLESPSGKLAGIGRVRLRSVSILEMAGKKTLSFNGLQIDLDIPGVPRSARTGEGSVLSADIDVAEKQPVMVGKTGREAPVVVLVSGEIAG